MTAMKAEDVETLLNRYENMMKVNVSMMNSNTSQSPTPPSEPGLSDTDIALIAPLLPPDLQERMKKKVCKDCVRFKYRMFDEDQCLIDQGINEITGERFKSYNSCHSQRSTSWCRQFFQISPKAMRRFLKAIPVDKRPIKDKP